MRRRGSISNNTTVTELTKIIVSVTALSTIESTTDSTIQMMNM